MNEDVYKQTMTSHPKVYQILKNDEDKETRLLAPQERAELTGTSRQRARRRHSQRRLDELRNPAHCAGRGSGGPRPQRAKVPPVPAQVAEGAVRSPGAEPHPERACPSRPTWPEALAFSVLKQESGTHWGWNGLSGNIRLCIF